MTYSEVTDAYRRILNKLRLKIFENVSNKSLGKCVRKELLELERRFFKEEYETNND